MKSLQTKYYTIKNSEKFAAQIKAVEKYIDYIERVIPTIEEIIGQTWGDYKMDIELNDSTSGASYCYCNNHHNIKIGINNKNIRKEYPENLWGCLFHETHHAFLNFIISGRRDGKILNGGHKAEVFNYAFMAITYLRLKEKNEISTPAYDYFLDKLSKELSDCNRKYRFSEKYRYEEDLPDNAMAIFREYVEIFSAKIGNLAKFISYIKSSDSVFTNANDFHQDLDGVKKIIGIHKNL